MSKILHGLAQRRLQLVARSAQQRQQLVQVGSDSVLRPQDPGWWRQVWRWRWPLIALVVPCAAVSLRRPALILKYSTWLWPAWQGWRAAQCLVQARSGLQTPDGPPYFPNVGPSQIPPR